VLRGLHLHRVLIGLTAFGALCIGSVTATEHSQSATRRPPAAVSGKHFGAVPQQATCSKSCRSVRYALRQAKTSLVHDTVGVWIV
jgi:hypothetical protein